MSVSLMTPCGTAAGPVVTSRWVTPGAASARIASAIEAEGRIGVGSSVTASIAGTKREPSSRRAISVRLVAQPAGRGAPVSTTSTACTPWEVIAWATCVSDAPPGTATTPGRMMLRTEVCTSAGAAIDLGPQRAQLGGRPLVAGSDQTGPAAAVDEQVVEGRAAQQPVIGGVDHREVFAERPLSAPRELELEALLGLSARREHAHRPVVPAGDVVRLELRRQHEVDAEHVVEAAVAQDRLGRQQGDDAAVDVEVATDVDRFDERRERDRDADEPPDRELGGGLRAEVVDPPTVHVVDDRRDGDLELAGRQ